MMPPQGLLRNRNFLWLWGGQAVSQVGDNISLIALPLLVLRFTGSPLKTGIAFGLEFVPYLLLSLVAGAMVDRMDRRRLMLVADFGRGVMMGIMPLAAAFGFLSLPLIYAIIVLTATLAVFFNIAYQSFLPAIVDRQQLAAANSRLQTASALATLFGPALGGALVAFWGPALSIALDALSFLLSGFSLLLVRSAATPPPAQSAGGPSVWASIRAGLAYLWNNALIRSAALLMLGVNLLISPMTVLMIMFGDRVLHLSSSAVGTIVAISGGGSLAASAVADRLSKRFGVGPISVAGTLAAGLLTLGIAASSWGSVVAGLWAVMSMVPVIVNVAIITMRQDLVPDHLLGRVNSAFRLLAWCAIPLSGALAGWAAENIGIRQTLVVIGTGLSLLAAAALFTPLRKRYLLPTEAEEQHV